MEARKAMFTNFSGPRDLYRPMIQLTSTLTQIHNRLPMITNLDPQLLSFFLNKNKSGTPSSCIFFLFLASGLAIVIIGEISVELILYGFSIPIVTGKY